MAKSKASKKSAAKKENEVDAAAMVVDLDTGARNPTNWSGQLITAVALVWAVFQIYIASNVPFTLAEITGSNLFVLNSDQNRAIHLALALFLASTAFPMFKTSPRDYIPWYDWIIALARNSTSAKVPEDVVYELAKAVLGNMDAFRKLHPAFKNLDPKAMIKDSLSAPLHKGAIKAYKELGLM